ncbi:MAG: amidohydrolase family protein [Rhodospirillaceae bacterium]|jgi:5-methylthioadenosine/S-adenosylhomocysteine deaminase|nr:amidohydrolase family protein [Rhodospirillaceae bacterium]
MAHGRTIIRNGRLLDAPNRRAEPADILIEGDEIREIGAPGMAAPEDAETIDAADRLMIPGLVNAHTHSHGNLAKGIGDHWNLELLINAGPWFNYERTREDLYTSAKLGAVEMVLRGCTACYDLVNEFPGPSVEGQAAVGQAYSDVGMRAVVTPMLSNVPFWTAIPGLKDALPKALQKEVEALKAAPMEKLAEISRRLLEEWPHDRDRINVAIAPTIPLLCTDEFLTVCRDIAEEHGAMLHTHMAESRVWSVGGYRTYGETLTKHFQKLGILGPRFTSAHAVWITEEDMKRMGDAGAHVAHNPVSNMRLGSGIADTILMRRHGVNVGIGTDACNCGDHLNMFENMRLACHSSRVKDHTNMEWLTAPEVIEMATECSARAMGFGDRIGRIAPGYQADIVFLDLADVSFIPFTDPCNQIVHCEDGAAVERVIVGGRTIVQGGKVTTVDMPALRREVETIMERLDSVQAERKELIEKLELPVSTYCNGLLPEHAQHAAANP